ncbi:unnamed protein product [Hyaloperonospora brassicae]|uniref:FYVE-type domain-containing protein n=1 Tax=Hyaloperonospora brassicae TaxID=162125 RepID=A0AAV0U733_HYABA|nr:unnamed protein product [Hyaloperonospora brassicae]
MNDPFFNEDDGDFDDLYGIPSQSSAHSLAAKHEPPHVDSIPPSHPFVLDTPSSMQSPAAADSVVSRSYVRDRTDSFSSVATDRVVASGPQTKWRKNHKNKTRRRTSQELFNVQWESDVHVATCRLCRSDFSLVKRKHHCRHCGRVVCSDCSCFVYFEFSRRKHRVCATCNNQLLAEQDAYERETMTSSSAVIKPQPRDGGATTANKTEKNVRKAEKQRRGETVEHEGKAALGSAPVTTFRIDAMDVESKAVAKGETLFEDADGSWFTDAANRQEHSCGSVVDESEDGDSKGPGWRDRVKDTYTVAPATDETSVLAPFAGSTLTSGITGKGYISDQFRYDDVSGPGLGHEDDTVAEMPRPEQHSHARMDLTESAMKPRWVSGNGILVEQLEYANLGGPGLGHEDDRSVAMPRPAQLATTVPYSYESERRDRRESKQDTTDDGTPNEHDHQTRTALGNMVSAPKHRDAALVRQREKSKVGKFRARGTQDMTLDELNLSCSSQDEPRMLGLTVAIPATAQPTFYEQDADRLVVDDLPGYFETTIAEREVQREKDERRQEQVARDNAWVNKAVVPRRLSSGHGSYSIVDRPSHTSNPPVVNQESRADDAEDNGKGAKPKSGFTKVLKRFFGMRPKKKSAPPKKSEPLPTVVVSPPKKDIVDHHASPAPRVNNRDSIVSASSAPDGLLRQSNVIADRSSVDQEKEDELKQHHQEPERKRRGTFDDLFMSPKDIVASNNFGGRIGIGGTSGWASRAGLDLNAGQPSIGAVGVARFDQRRPAGEDDEHTLGNKPAPAVGSSQSTEDSTEAWRESAALLLLQDRRDSAQDSGFTWSSIQPVPGLGTATDAISTSLQSYAAYNENRGVSASHKTPVLKLASTGGIMDDLKHGSTLSKPQGETSIDEFFAEFEETSEYVFDSTTGGYVAARVPVRAATTRNAQQLESTEPLGSEKYTLDTDDRRYDTLSATKNGGSGSGVVVEDEVAEIIVDKISSLESELAALKKLIRSRKGSGDNQSRKLHNGRGMVDSSARKESIFDHDSSDEDDGRSGDSYGVSIRPKLEQKRRRRGSKKRLIKERKDSFADLFADSPNEHQSVGGALSYNALSRKAFSNDDSDSETEFTSPQNRQGKQSSQWTMDEDVYDASSSVDATMMSAKLSTKQATTRKAGAEALEDPIDALFDTSKDRDVTKLYGGEDGHDEKDKRSVPESRDVLVRTSSDDEVSGSAAAVTDNISSVVPGSIAAPSSSHSVNLPEFGAADEDEDFSINWSKMRKTKPRRHKSHHVTGESSATTDGSVELAELNLYAEELKLSTSDIPVEHTAPVPFVVDASSTVRTAEDEAINLSSRGGESSESQSTIESPHLEAAIDAVPSSGVPARKRNDPVEQSLLASIGSVEKLADTTVEVSLMDAAAFDIFDKSGDVDISSMSSLTGANTPDGQDDCCDSDDNNASFSGTDETFSFELQTPKKRLPVDVPTKHFTTRTDSDPSESSLELPTLLELGKYATASIPSSSRTPSIDGSIDDLEHASVDDDSVIEGSVGSEAFAMDWQQMQAKEKERKKRLQVKQRQAQRDKQKQVEERQTEEKGADKDDAASSSLHHHKKSGSSRKHHGSATNRAPVTMSDPSRTLTDL